MDPSISLSNIARIAHVQEENIQNVFVVGSRAWGTSNQASDWDMFVVCLDGKTPNEVQIEDEGVINLTIFSMTSWRRWLIQDHTLQAIACLFLPEQNILLNMKDWKAEFQLDRKKLKFAALRKSASSFNRARIYCLAYEDHFNPLPDGKLRVELTHEDAKGLKGLEAPVWIRKFKKMIAHSFRTCLFAKQLYETGSIYDLKCVSKLWEEIDSTETTDWGYYDAKYRDQYHKITEDFPEDAGLNDPVKDCIPNYLHRLYELTLLPRFQGNYWDAIHLELFKLVRQYVVENDNMIPSLESEWSLKEDVAAFFPDLTQILETQYNTFRTLANFLQTTFDERLVVATFESQKKGTPLGQELAIACKDVKHFALIFQMLKKNQFNGVAYIAACPSTHIDIMKSSYRDKYTDSPI